MIKIPKCSIKYKFLIVLLVIPTIASLAYYFIARSIFVNDKMAYIFEANLQSTKSLANEMNSVFKSIDHYTWYLEKFEFNDNDNVNENKRLINNVIKNNSSIDSISVFDKSGQLILTSSPNKLQMPVLKDLNSNFFYLDEKNVLNFQRKISEQYFILTSFKSNLIHSLSSLTPFDEIIVLNLNDEIIFSNSLRPVSEQVKIGNLSSQKSGKISAQIFNDQNAGKYIISHDYQTILGLKLATLFSWEKALVPIQQLTQQSIIFFVIVVSVTIIISLFMSSQLTAGINNLFNATTQISEQNYDVRVDIDSNDEVGVLAQSFNSMIFKIKTLLNELKAYNEKLEHMVEERTRELSSALRLQKSIMDSVDQGFTIFGANGLSKSVASKSATIHFGTEITSNTNLFSLFAGSMDPKTMETLFEHIFSGIIPFKDLTALLPKMKIVQSKYIFFNYFPFLNETNQLEGLVVVSSDKTKEVEALNKNEVIQKRSNMVLAIISDFEQFKTILIKTNLILHNLKNLNDTSIEELFREVHTIKASLMLFSVQEPAECFHQLEDILTDKKELDQVTVELIKTKVADIEHHFSQFFENYGKYLGLNNLNELDGQYSVKVNYHSLIKLLDEIANKNYDIAERLKKFLFAVPIKQFCSFYFRYAQEVAKNQNKEVVFTIDEKQIIMTNNLDEFKSALIHVFTNAVIHGIESKEERSNKGKEEVGHIGFSYSEDKSYRIFSIKDDGQGISLEKIRAKLKAIGDMKADLYSDSELENFIFEENFSTQDEISELAGRGVGLVALKHEVNRLGGKIEINTQKDYGTEFKFYIPMT